MHWRVLALLMWPTVAFTTYSQQELPTLSVDNYRRCKRSHRFRLALLKETFMKRVGLGSAQVS